MSLFDNNQNNQNNNNNNSRNVNGNSTHNPLNWEIVIVINKLKDKYATSTLSNTTELLSLNKLVTQVHIGELDQNNIFILVGSYESDLRHFAKSSLIRSGIGMIHDHTLFTEAERLHIIENRLQVDQRLKYLYDNDSIEMFPYHQPDQLKILRKQWYKGRIFNLPSNIANRYFGEEISFYFLFLNFYNFGLFLLSLFGIPVSIIQYVTDPYMISGALFAVLMCIFSSFFLEVWKRFQSIYAWNWHSNDFRDGEQALPSYKTSHNKIGVYHSDIFLTKKDFTENELELVEPYMTDIPYMSKKRSRTKSLKMTFTFTVVTVLVLLVAMSTIAIFSLRIVLKAIQEQLIGTSLGSVISACFIQLFNYVYRMLAYWLTRYEGHRIQSTFNQSLTVKLFLFQFVNTFSGLFYIGFVKDNVELWGDKGLEDTCSYSNRLPGLWKGCVTDLEFQIFSIILVNFFSGIFTELILPKLIVYVNKIKGHTKFSKKSSLPCEEQFYLPKFDTFDEFNEIIIQFALISMFAGVLPFSPLLALINNIFENKIDAYKLCYSHRRPTYKGSNGIGHWYRFLVLIGVFSVITNSLFIGFSFPTLLKFTNDPYTILWTVVILEHMILMFKWVVSALIPDQTHLVRKMKSIHGFVKIAILDKYLSDHGLGNRNSLINVQAEGFEFNNPHHRDDPNHEATGNIIAQFFDANPPEEKEKDDDDDDENISPIHIIATTFGKIEGAL
ncbi:hypothetical protein DFA_04856 [Cavenderia fasciculata]|uniref:Anoctamin transmembrane domain-containing protein n=1 Tax=Cavenderia fasciculata TaxID=261658 RepID=F4PM23_CACFS|nr:uncharacterized protein DFA_04856 [Cavenderia fasciculata]EGG22726.1 hypothetical protein DFA_04856 [Cavenderia fasciculata]|eukprot:XP_004360577.1 hypothetical protein DFA_04856 [Cavenderia fasciculata]